MVYQGFMSIAIAYEMFHLPTLLLLLCACSWETVFGGRRERQGPMFTFEPPSRVEFMNTTGVVIPCSAQGNPSPLISWVKHDGTPVTDIAGLRHIRPDGSLVFLPFRAEEYRQDIHASVYKCVAENLVGSIGSREVNVRAGVKQYYEAQVYDDFVIKGNTAVLRCHIPSFVKEYVTVTSWLRNDGAVIHSNAAAGGRFSVFPTGELHVRYVDPSTDRGRQYRCQTKHRLTGEVKKSVHFGQLIITEPHSNVPPRFAAHRSHMSALQGDTLELPCAAQGYPVPTYRWFKEEGGHVMPVALGQRTFQVDGTLVIQQAITTDTGKYICIANNSVGEAKIEIEVLVRAPLSVIVIPSHFLATEGDAVYLNCTATGYPIKSLTWVKNRRKLVANGRVRFPRRDLLQISPIAREDRGMYQCYAGNDFESAQGSAELTLGDDPPTFIYTFTDQTTEAGPFLSLKCVATGSPLPQITWSLDGSPIVENLRIRVGDYVTSEGYVNSFVNITSVRTEDGGKYECHAGNEVDSITHSGRVNVYGPPFIRPMRNMSVLAGETLVMRCPVAGYPIAQIAWEKNSIRLPQNHRQTVHANGTLVIEKVERGSDEDEYRCIASNNDGDVASKGVFVKVLVAPVVNPFFFPANLREGMRSIVTCSVLEGDPPITLTWLKDGEPLRSDSNVIIETSNEFSTTLFIKKVAFNNNGNYTCVASNTAASANHTSMMVVNVPPRWKIAPTDKSVVMGNNMVVDCQADGFPQPRIWWEKSTGVTPGQYKTIISNSHIHILENGSLSIRETTEDDEGHYLCQATNGIGSGLSKVVKLTVHIAAHFKAKFSAQTMKKGDSSTLRCEAFGEKPISISWSKDRQEFDPLSDSRYKLHQEETDNAVINVIHVMEVDRRDSALFTCSAQNAHGRDETNIQLIVQEPPDSPSNILASDIGSRTITLMWSQPYSGNSPLTSYKVEYKKASDSWEEDGQVMTVSGSETSAIVRGLRPVTTYHIRVAAENAQGWSDYSQAVHINTAEEAPEGPPTSVHASAIASHTIQVSWQPPRKDLRNGPIKGYYVGYKIFGSPESYIHKTIEVQEDANHEILLTHLKRATKYAIIVQAFNDKGTGPHSEEIILETLENDPPSSPGLTIISSTSSSIQLSWAKDDMSDIESGSVTGYFLYYKKQYSTWEERQIPGHQTAYTFHDLYCGTHYQFYIVAYNTVGKGEPSDVIGAKTQGTVPIAPKREALITVNATSVTLNLNSWHSGGCSINFFVVQYKANLQHEWILVSNNVLPDQRFLEITDLVPGTWYTLLMTAHSDAGPTEAEYVFATLTATGATIPPLMNLEDRRPIFYKSLGIVVPTACAVIVLVVIVIVACVVVRKRRTMDQLPRGESRLRDDKNMEGMSMAVLDRKATSSTESGSPNKEPLYFPSPYATSRISMFTQHEASETECSHSLRRSLARHEHVYDVPFPPKWITEETYSHIMETSSMPLPMNLYQTPRMNQHQAVKASPLPPDHQYRSPHLHLSQRIGYEPSSFVSDCHSPNDSDSEGAAYMFNRDLSGSYIDSQEMSEAECDRDQRMLEKMKRYSGLDRLDGFQITAT